MYTAQGYKAGEEQYTYKDMFKLELVSTGSF